VGLHVTALTKDLEFSGYALTFWLLGRRYRTYECYVADEVRGVLKDHKNFKNGPLMVWPFIVQDRNLVTSRWPLDAPLYTRRFAEMVADAKVRSKKENYGENHFFMFLLFLAKVIDFLVSNCPQIPEPWFKYLRSTL